ncbi:MAG: hypothetical protein K0R03_1591 [Moraxellaceae bacterium]|jgi:chromosome segregation ATPase|nr:hypothetical protein [Moraxellaceae bacterium]
MLKKIALLLALSLGTPFSLAADDGEAKARWFRYYDDRGQPNVTDTVTPEHVSRGYEELTAKFSLIRKVPPQKPLTAAELAAAKAKREQEARQVKEDKQLRRLYSSPQDAEKARNRQLDALQLRIDFSSNSLANLRQRRAEEAQRAAVFERQGKPVPADLKESIAAYDRQIQNAQKEINARKAEQEKVRAEYAPIIQRLQELTGKPASKPAAAGTAAPATARP